MKAVDRITADIREECSRERSHDQDLELARAALAGSREARRRFAEVARCVPRILSVQNSRVGSPLTASDLEDLAQETVVTIWRKLGEYEGHAALTTWMYRFCHFNLVAFLRKCERRGEIVELVEPERDNAEPVSLRFEHLYRALEIVGSDNASVVRMKHFEALSFDEIGARLRMPPSTVKSTYYRTLAWLREILAHEDPELVL